jgi:hypothetical protein
MPKSKRPPIRSIPNAVQPEAKTLLFSFKHLDTNHTKFPLAGCSTEFWISLANALKRYSLGTVEDFLVQDHADGRHLITWGETTEPEGFAHLDMEQVGYSDPWQFSVGTQRGRVHGLLVEPMFYIIWLDPHHNLFKAVDYSCG